MSSPAQQIAIAIVERDGQFLIGQRPQGVPLAGYWEFPGGKMHAGETPQQSAVRECLEETGLPVEAVRVEPASLHEYPHGRLTLHFVICQPLNQDQPQAPFRWVGRAELAGYRFPEANQQIVRMLVENR